MHLLTRVAAVFLVLLALSEATLAAVITWDSGSAVPTDNWNDLANWTPETALPGASDTALFNQTAEGATNGNSIVNTSFTIQKLSYGATNSPPSPLSLSYTTAIPVGVTLRVDGDASTGLDQADLQVGNYETQTAYTGTAIVTTTISGAGTLQIGASAASETADFLVARRPNVGAANAGNVTATLDLSGLSTFNAYVDEFMVGLSGQIAAAATGTVTLGTTNTIRANTLTLGHTYNAGGGSGTLNLGQTNTLYADTIYVGRQKLNGTLQFRSGLTNPTVTIANQAGTGRANLYVGYNDVSTGATTTSQFNGTNGIVIADLNNLHVGSKSGGSGGGGAIATLTIGSNAANDFDVTTLVVGRRADTSTGTVSGTLNLNGGTFLAGSAIVGSETAASTSVATGVLNVNGGTFTTGSLALGQLTSGAGATGTLTQTGGTVNVTGAVSDGGGTSTLNVNGGTMTIGTGLTVDTLRVGYLNGASGSAVTGSLTDSGGAVSIGTGTQTVDLGFRDGSASDVDVRGTLSLQNASSVNVNVATLRFGNVLSGSTRQAWGILNLSNAGTNTIAATTLLMGDSGFSTNAAQTSFLHLGGAANNVGVDTFTIAGRKSTATVDILPGGTLTLGGKSLAECDLRIGYNNENTGVIATGHLNMTGGTLNATLDDVVLGLHNLGAGAGVGTFTMAAGTVTANTIRMALPSQGGTSSNPLNTTGTFNLKGGTLTAGSITKGAGTANFNWTGGTLHVGTFGFDLTQDDTDGLSILAPGASPGTTIILGDYDQLGGFLEIEINGDAQGSDPGYDFLDVAGAATLNDTLQVVLRDGFVPALGGQFDVLTATSIILGSGFQFDQSQADMWPQMFEYQIVPGGNGEILQLTAITPEPTSMALLALGGLGLLRRRRRARSGAK